MTDKLSANMYGADDCDFAEKIASDALTPIGGWAATNESDYWGKTIDQEARAKGGSGDTWNPDVKIIRKADAGNTESEVMDDSTKGGQRHRREPGSLGKK